MLTYVYSLCINNYYSRYIYNIVFAYSSHITTTYYQHRRTNKRSFPIHLIGSRQ